MLLKEAIILNSALMHCLTVEEKLDGEVKNVIATNLKRLRPIITSYEEDEKIRIDSYAKKDEKNEPVIIGGKFIDFGDNTKAALDRHEELMKEEVTFKPYTIKKSALTNALPINVQVELLDIIILED